jgi:glycerol-3-phosphate cytidylyltransferase
MNAWVYVGGTFDLFHYGHARFLEQCAQHGKVIVAINTDDFCDRYKRKPVLTLGERIESVRSCRWVDDVITNIGDEDSGLTIDTIRDKEVKYIAHGDDWTGDALIDQLGISHEWLHMRGISMLYIPYTKGISTSDIIGRVRGDVHSSCNCSRERGSNDSDGCCASCSE